MKIQKKKYPYITIIILILLSGCSSKFVTGVYNDKQNSNNFKFFADSTFEYIYAANYREESTGRWSKNGNIIRLNSYNKKQRFDMDTVIWKTKNKHITINLQLNVSGINNGCSELVSEKDYVCTPQIELFRKLEYGIRGSYTFILPKSPEELSFSVFKAPERFCTTHPFYYPIETNALLLNLHRGDSLCVTINIVDSLFNYKVFDNTPIIIRNKDKIFYNDGKQINKLKRAMGNVSNL